MNTDTSARQPTEQTPGSNVALTWLLKSLIAVFVTAALLFVPAGRLDWVMGWVLVAMFAIVPILQLLIADPDLVVERSRRSKDARRWDTIILGSYGVLTLVVTPVVAGLNVRLGWPPEIPAAVQVIALIVSILGWAMHLWAMASNRFFSKIVRIQEDRGQTVVTGGPYRYMRHPGYASAVIVNLTMPLMLGSLWAFIAGAFGALLMIIRTALEDRTLLAELPGYTDFAARVRYRLLPGVW